MSKMKYSAIGKHAPKEEKKRQKKAKKYPGYSEVVPTLFPGSAPVPVQTAIDLSDSDDAPMYEAVAPHDTVMPNGRESSHSDLHSTANGAESNSYEYAAPSANSSTTQFTSDATVSYGGEAVRSRTSTKKKNSLRKQLNELSKKEKGIVSGVAAAVLLIIIICVATSLKPDAAQQVTAVEAIVADVQQTVTVSGTVSSTSKTNFMAANGVTVKDVSVALGQVVEAGQLLATFDVSSLDEELSAKEQAYTQSKQTYDDAIEQAKVAAEQLPEINERIAELEASIAASGDDSEDFSVEDILSNFSLDKLTEMFEQLGSTISGAFDMSSMLGTGYSQEQTELVELQAQKLVLESQASNTMSDVYKSLMASALAAYESYKAAYEAMSVGWTAKESGVITAINIKPGEAFNVADATEEFDINSVISGLQAGLSVDSLLTSVNGNDLANGIVIDNYSGFIVEFDINQYDIPKVALSQTATIKVAGNATAYTGKVTYISPVISSGSTSLDISSIAGSLTGGTASALEASVSVDNPDKSMIIGMTVSMELNTAFVAQTTAVPIEAIYIDGTDMYVYVIENKRVKKQLLEVGISSNTLYQIVSGCNVGDKLVKNPLSSLEDGSRVKVTEAK